MAYYTCLVGIGAGATNVTFTHGLSITPSSLVARPILHQVALTHTSPISVLTIGTNIVTVGTAGTLQTFDLEVQQVHSLIL